MNSQIRSCETHTPNLRIPNSQKISGHKNHKLGGFTLGSTMNVCSDFHLITAKKKEFCKLMQEE